MKSTLRLLPLAGAFVLGGCFSFGAKPPPQLMTLRPAATLPAATDRSVSSSQAVTVITPSVPQELATLRVPVRTGATSLAYLKDAQWVEMPASLFARLLSETIGATTGRVVLDARQFTFDPGLRLTGQLKEFGVNADTHEVVIVYDAALSRAAGQVETHRFEARAPVAAIDEASVASALNQAANQVATDVAGWIGK